MPNYKCLYELNILNKELCIMNYALPLSHLQILLYEYWRMISLSQD